MPYTHYMVKVVAINGVGEGRPVNSTVTTDEEGSIILNFIIIAIVPLLKFIAYIFPLIIVISNVNFYLYFSLSMFF